MQYRVREWESYGIGTSSFAPKHLAAICRIFSDEVQTALVWFSAVKSKQLPPFSDVSIHQRQLVVQRSALRLFALGARIGPHNISSGVGRAEILK